MKWLLVYSVILFATVVGGLVIVTRDEEVKIEPVISNTPSLEPTVTATPIPTPTATATPTLIPLPKVIFGIGSQAGPAMDYRIVKEAPFHMLSSWYNGPSDLVWMRIQQNDLVPRLYKNKFIVHLITWTDLPEENIQTSFGPACGRPYPVSSQVVDDMKQLAEIYNGNGPMYVTLFTEFNTFTCIDNNWVGNENYFNALKDNFRKIKAIFKQYAPKSQIGFSWGGWQASYDDPTNKGGRSLFPYFADLMKESDFTAFQSMESDTNVDDIINMTRILGTYKKPVMLAHYKPANDSQAVFDADIKSIFTDETMRKLTNYGLFAMSFMDYNQISNNEASFQFIKRAIQKYAK